MVIHSTIAEIDRQGNSTTGNHGDPSESMNSAAAMVFL